MSNDARTTAIFSKKPEPGSVKTRLVPRLGAEGAADLAEAMLDDTVARCTSTRGFETLVCVTPSVEQRWFRARYPAVARIVPQIGAGLAGRLAHCAREELAAAGRTLVFLGGDAPHAPARACVDAHEELEGGADVVLGLDDGGGYWLIGLREPHAELFTRVAMSTADMGARTVELAQSMGLRVGFVDASYDIDEPRDLDRLLDELRRDETLRARIPRTAAFLARSAGS